MTRPRLSSGPALSVRQPWAWLIVNGHKNVENRTWTTRHRGPLLIHAAQKIDRAGIVKVQRQIVLPEEYDLGAIVGLVRLRNIVTDSRSPWALPGQYHWLLDEPELMRPIDCRGSLGLFTPERRR